MLRGQNIELRALEPADIDLLYAWENDDLTRYVSNSSTPFSRFALEQYVLNVDNDIFRTKQLRLMIDKKTHGTKETVGSIDLFDFDPLNKRAGIGILIIQQERKKGYASESLQLLIDYCFQVLHLHQVYCNISADNVASLALFRKFNFQIIGVKKEWLHIRGKWVDEYLLQLLNK